ncbi:unnamed protein product [Orchesella dallaii]|uniref:Gustatory receptor n=1 Tax=Orchesella dallaii TaxID=48710 RepID=A0ABP1R9H8_9HEXA
MEQTFTKILKTKKLIFAAVFYGLIFSYLGLFLELWAATKPMKEWPWVVYFSPIFVAAYWVLNHLLLLLPRLWIVNLFNCLKLCSIDLKTRVEHLKKGILSPTDFNSILNRFQRLEEFVKLYNDVYGWYNAVDIINLTVAITLMLFQIVDFLLDFHFSGAYTFLFPLGLNVIVLFEMFDEANSFELETKKCASILRQIPCVISDFEGNVTVNGELEVLMLANKFFVQPLAITPGSFFKMNRGSLASIASVITTYLVVLAQFYSGDEIP